MNIEVRAGRILWSAASGFSVFNICDTQVSFKLTAQSGGLGDMVIWCGPHTKKGV